MGLMLRLSELLLKGAIASYLLLYAFEFHTQPKIWQQKIRTNLDTYASYMSLQTEPIKSYIASGLVLYSRWLVLVSALLLMGLRSGRVFSTLSMFLTLLLCWNDTQWLFIGVNMILYATLFG